jgi:hypothetical protein
MKTFPIVTLLVLLFITLGAGIQDYLADLKISMQDVQQFVEEDLVHGNFGFPAACARIPQSKRAAVAKAAGEFARSFTQTQTFVAWYDEYREQCKPKPPAMNPTMEESRSSQVTALKQQIAETEKTAAAAPAEQRAIFNDVLKALRTSLADLQKTDKGQDAEINKMVAQANVDAKKEYADKLAAFEKEYPKGNPRPLIKARLKSFLEQTEGIDYSAKLVKNEKLMVFANPEYEKKPSEWKAAFRAGKEATETARGIAREWLKSLQ